MNAQTKVDQLKIFTCQTREEMGEYAAMVAADEIKEMLQQKKELNVVFAAAPSQNEFLAFLQKAKGIDWGRINAFHMDEYVGLKIGESGSFTNFLNNAIFNILPFKNIYRINGAASDADEECKRYSIDCKVKVGDAVIEIPGFEQKVGALSTFANAFTLNCVVVEAINMLVNEGINPPVWRSGNCTGGDEWNNQFIQKFRGAVRCL